MLDIIVSQGRVADRSAQTIIGARLTAAAVAQHYPASTQTIGTPTAPAFDDWTESLPQAYKTLDALGSALAAAITRDTFPLLINSTCPASIATLPIVAHAYPEAVVLWVDAHGDFNTPETTDTGYLGGMVVAAGCGLWDSGHGAGLNPHQVILLGARDIDEPEAELLAQAGVAIIPPAQATPEAVLTALAGRPVWIHIDWDSLEPGYVPADYAVPNGLLPDQLRDIFTAIPKNHCLGLEIAEFHASDGESENQAATTNILKIIEPLLPSP
jgi:arginase/N-omega-hydroxy-L-arginine amidinohydrolase